MVRSIHTHIRLLFGLALMILSLNISAQSQSHTISRQSVQDCPFFVPNAFTPNGDGINDVFYITNSEDCIITNVEMTIFDRWGRVVYTADNLRKEEAWDGTFEGKTLKQGVYMYKIQLNMRSVNNRTEPKLIQRQGTVVLLR